MTLKIEKTEAEAQKIFHREMDKYGAWVAIKAALDLEFEEPEGRGEGVPEELGWRPYGDARVANILDGETGKEIGLVSASTGVSWAALEKALGAYNDLPALLTLARELEGEVGNHHDMREMGECSGCPTCDLLDRAGKLRRRLEGVRG